MTRHHSDVVVRRLRPGTFVHQIRPGVLQVGSQPESMVLLSGLSETDMKWVFALADKPRERRRTRRPTGSLSSSQEEILGYLDAANLLQATTAPLSDLSVRVLGLDGVGARLAVLLAAAGIGAIEVRDRRIVDARVELAFPPGSAGMIRQSALRSHLRRVFPRVRVGTLSNPDLVVVLGRRAWDHGVLGKLLSEGQVHLPVTQDNESVTIGPLVAPGVTACALCVDLHRRQASPLWAESSLAMSAAPAVSPPEDVSAAAAGLMVGMLTSIASSKTLVGASEPMGRVDGDSQSWLVTRRGVRTYNWRPHQTCLCRQQTAFAHVHKDGESAPAHGAGKAA